MRCAMIVSYSGGKPGSTFDGLIEEVAIYRRALGAEQLVNHYRRVK